MRCRKVRYRDDFSSQLALWKIIRQRNDQLRAKRPVRSYACPYCKGWHLTSQRKK